MNIILCGHQNSGKSSIAQAYAQKYHCQAIDTDTLLLEHPHQSLRNMYLQLGEAQFRAKEAQCIQSLMPKQPCIIATGGGALLDAKNTVHLQKLGPIIYLHTPLTLLLERSVTFPPWINSKEAFEQDYQQRDAIYRSAADHTLSTEQYTVDEMIDFISKVAMPKHS